MILKALQRTALLFSLFLSYASSQAQVTIGSAEEANKGSLLDLKEKNTQGANSSKGLLLPRVKLLDHEKLQPMYSYTEGNTPTEAELSAHEGLVVYNTNGCAPFGFGSYVWIGNKWVNISEINSIPLPSETINIDTLHILSGMDARGSSPAALTFQWIGESPMFGMPTSAATGSISGPIEFTSLRGLTPSSGSWESSPATLSVWANDMTTSLVTPSSPWKTRQSLLNLIIKGNDCGPTYSKQLYLNQTNYAMIAGSAASPVTDVKLKNTDGGQIKILSNVPWIAYTVANSSDWSVTKVLSSYTTELKDKTNSDGTTGSDDDFVYKAAAAGIGTRFTSVTVTFKDPEQRAKDIKINIEQCDGTPLMKDVLTATPTETSSGSTSWAGKVVRHEAKANVYEEFYSADFGTAGRWMITNLAAKAYDGVSHSASRTLSGPQANSNSAYNAAYWAYPSKTSLIDATEFNKNPHLGYLYTWDAASGGKGGTDGKQNQDRISSGTNSWVGDRSESALSEWLGEVNASNRPKDSQKRRQGICPKGWHLPSDYEWTLLEQEIVRNTKKYSNVSNNIDSGDGVQLAAVPQAAILNEKDTSGSSDKWRGSTHGQAMKDACELDFKGTSNHAASNGFSLQLPGFGDKSTAYGFGQEGMYWTSSIAHGEAAYGRKFGTDGGVYRNDVYRYRPYRYYQFSVRCKKD